MTGKELILKALRHEELPRVPWIPYTGVQIGSLKGYDAETLLKDADKLLECLIESNHQYVPDGQPVIFDLQVEAEILGCELQWEKKGPPTVKSHPLTADKTIPARIPAKEDGRLPLILDVMRRFKKEVGDTTALYGLACGPFTLAGHLRGTDIFMDMYDDEDYVKELLSYCADVFIAMSDYFIEAGMDVIGAVDPLVSQISPEMFNQFLSEPYTKVFSHLRDKNTPSAFFVCGDATKNLEVMADTRPDCLSIDENIDIAAAKKVTDAKGITISGNMQLTITMLLGTQQDNQKLALELINTLGKKDFILAPGCDMPYDVPPQNIVGVAQAVQDPENTSKMLESYEKKDTLPEVELPDYENLDHVLLEVLTIDSKTCAACGFMKAAADDMLKVFGDKVKVVEHKITEPVNIARIMKMGVGNLPALAINGQVKHISLIPSRKALEEEVKALL